MGDDNKKFLNKIQHEYVDVIKNINTLPLSDVNKISAAQKKIDGHSKTQLREALKLKVK